MKTDRLIAALALLAGCCMGCGAAESPAPAADAADGSTVVLKPGEKRVFTLHENITTGFSWSAKTEGEKVSVTIEHLGPPKSKVPTCGAPGSAKVTIEAPAGFKGPATVTLRYARSWSEEGLETRTIKVVSGN